MQHQHHHEHHEHYGHHAEDMESPREYAKFAAVIAGIIFGSLLLSEWRGWGMESWMANFMGVFFLVFGGFKLVNLQMFVLTYRSYDILARRFKLWGWLFPFIELGLAAGYLLLGNELLLNLATILLTATASIGVVRELLRKSDFKCACLGTVIKLPLSKVTFVENFAMLAMAAIMLFL